VIELATTGDELFISGQSGLSIVAHRHYRRIDPEMDTLLVMGGPNARKTCGVPVFEWLRQMAPGVRRMGSVCTVALLLAEAGLLNRDMGITPARYILQLRLEAARKSLEQTDTGIEQIAGDCGFGSVEVLRRSFLRHLGTTPALYRDRFRHSRPGLVRTP